MKRLEVGATFCDRFRLVSSLGSDVLGEIWRAHDSESSADVVIRFFGAVATVDDAIVGRFTESLRSERLDNRRLTHPSIVPIAGIHDDNGRHFLSMQLIDGNDLMSLIDGSIEDIVGIILRVCDTLEYTHGQGVVHGAIRRTSIVIDRRGRTYLTDIGIERLAVAAGLTDAGTGALATISPQILDGQPATVADDVYAIGALLFELVTGDVLFGDSVSREQVIRNRPIIPVKSTTGRTLPQSLVTLLEVMLDKQRERRPAGVAAVRAVLSDVLQDLEGSTPVDSAGFPGDGQLIKPVKRQTSISAPARESRVTPVDNEAPAFPAGLFYGAIGLLTCIALAVLFVLPRVIENSGSIEMERPSLSERAIPAEKSSPTIDPRTLQAQKELAERALGQVLAGLDQLLAIGADLWGGADWAEARRLAVDGDAALKSRDYTSALGHYQQSGVLLDLLQQSSDNVLNQALTDGQEAYFDNDHLAAVRAFEIALAIDKKNEVARDGLETAMLLPKLIELAAQAVELEATGDLTGAMNLFRRARSMDSGWRIAQEGITRLTAQIARNDYETLMARGYSELSQDDLDAAHRAFKAARAVRPGDSDASAALSQIADLRKFRRISAFQVRAREAIAAERWDDAISAYQSALNIDSTIDELTTGLSSSRSRAELDRSLNEYLAKADQFNRDTISEKARAVLREAGVVEEPGTILQSQIGNLSKLLAIAQIPLSIRIESDSMTRVSIHRVGKLGLFAEKTIRLKPGTYVAVGVRNGFRDVRREFLVKADGSTSVVVIRCEEPI